MSVVNIILFASVFVRFANKFVQIRQDLVGDVIVQQQLLTMVEIC